MTVTAIAVSFGSEQSEAGGSNSGTIASIHPPWRAFQTDCLEIQSEALADTNERPRAAKSIFIDAGWKKILFCFVFLKKSSDITKHLMLRRCVATCCTFHCLLHVFIVAVHAVYIWRGAALTSLPVLQWETRWLRWWWGIVWVLLGVTG